MLSFPNHCLVLHGKGIWELHELLHEGRERPGLDDGRTRRLWNNDGAIFSQGGIARSAFEYQSLNLISRN